MSRARWALALAGLLVAAVPIVGDHRAADADVPPPSKRVYMITDSVGLGANERDAGRLRFGLGVHARRRRRRVHRDARDQVRPPAADTTPWVFGDYAIVAAGYNYPYWDPARFDRIIDTMIATLLEAGVKHVFWVTLRDVKPQYISPGAWRRDPAVLLVLPDGQRPPRAALARHPSLSLIDWAAVADQPGLTYDAIHLNTQGSALYSAIARQAVIDATTAAPEGAVARIAIPDAAGVQAVALNLTTVAPRCARLPDRL